MFEIRRYQGMAPVAMSATRKFSRPSPPASESTPTVKDQAHIGSAPGKIGAVVMGIGVLATTGMVGATLGGYFANPLIVVAGAIASLSAVAAGAVMLDNASSRGPQKFPVTSDVHMRQTLPLGTSAPLGGFSQSLDLASGQLHQEVNLGNGWYLDPSTGQMVYHY